jgi:hypothetical protein
MRRFAPLVALALVAAGCGSASQAPPRPKAPRLPRALAQSWAQQADAVATALAAGDGCAAQARAAALQRDVIAAVNAHRVPVRLLEPLSSGLNDLAGRITCTPPTTTAPPPPQPPGHDKPKPHGPGHGHGHDKHGEGD